MRFARKVEDARVSGHLTLDTNQTLVRNFINYTFFLCFLFFIDLFSSLTDRRDKSSHGRRPRV